MPIILNFIAAENSVAFLRELLALRQNPNSPDVSGKTPIHIAILKRERSPEERNEMLLMVHDLISFGANVDLRDVFGCTPLHFATASRDYEVIKILLDSQAEINRKDIDGNTALHYATTASTIHRNNDVLSDHDAEPSIVKLLLRYNPDVNIQNNAGETPLMLAVKDDNLFIVRAMLKKNASVDLQNAYGETVLHHALDREEVNVDIVSKLFRKGCSFTVTNNIGDSPKDAYFKRLLMNHTPTQVEKAKQVIKVFMLKNKYFNGFEEACIKTVDEANKNRKLYQFLKSCYKEIKKMKNDILAPSCSVFNVALRDVFCLNFETDERIARVLFDKVLDRLIARRFPRYCDVIASGISRSYMNVKFAEMCCNRHSGISVFDYDSLCLIAKYMSNLEMLNLIAACSRVVRRPSVLSCFTLWERFH